MIDRSYLQITGPPGEGKTTLMTRVLQARDGVLRVARCSLTREPGFRVSDEPDDTELRRYRNAGASRPVRLRFDTDARKAGAFWDSTFLHEYYQNAIFEGAMPFEGRSDLTVFVCRPTDVPLLVREEVGAAPRQDDPEAVATALRSFLAGQLGPAFDIDGLEASIRAHATKTLGGESRHKTGKVAWRLADGYEELLRAKVVVFNVRSDDERALAATRAEEVERIRKDDEVRKAFLRWGVDRRPVMIRTVDLKSETSAAMTSLVKRITRELR